jgi:MbtH protein
MQSTPEPVDFRLEETADVNSADENDRRIFKVVVNHEEQYSIWFADRETPPGWSDAGKEGTKAECLAFIQTIWTDMRPKSLRDLMEQREPTPE